MIAIASDHAGYALKERIKLLLNKLSLPFLDFGTGSDASVDYPDYAFAAASAVGNGECDRGILICGSGVGMCIVANKISGVRAADCLTVETATMARHHNDINVLTMGQRLVDPAIEDAIVNAFLTTPFDGGRHERRVEKIHSLTGR